ncbi:hypothetical protein NCCP2716_01440 [Sporosarcina sp. NCCP-2716]|uniref:DUF58 domain-containing protein n=1 Tax=Sporosarcina sp. NCCP-2716 TaxID=2943679 RepID=UPI00203DF2F1|nr:DUF58 domain-containing protein [Sporosarcina sp. NCCP-2716]GKV67646.1 hypothetical protein NCCP2716_01440 [Sporosarcina sp. NCCP-2716]
MTLLFPPSLAARIGRLAFVRYGGRLGHHKGGHLSKKTGASLEFSDFKEYHPGDDIRHIDWNVYARTDTYYVKQFLDEQELRVHIVLDASRSMDFEGKWPFAQQIAIGLGQIALKNGDGVSISRTADAAEKPVKRKGAAQSKAWTSRIASFDEPSGNRAVTDSLAGIPHGTSLLFIITDALEPNDVLHDWFRSLAARCRDVRLIVVRSAAEQHPDFSGDLRLVDSEDDRQAEVSMTSSAEQAYLHRAEQHKKKLLESAAKYGVDVLFTSPQTGPENVFSRQMRDARWVR